MNLDAIDRVLEDGITPLNRLDTTMPIELVEHIRKEGIHPAFRTPLPVLAIPLK